MQIEPANSQAHYQTYYIQYQSEYSTLIMQTMEGLARTYATFKYLEYSSDLLKEINQHYHQIKLTKRVVIFAVLTPDNPEAPPVGSKRIIISDKADISKGHILVNQQMNSECLSFDLIKKLQLDSIWVGLLYRIGTDVQEFQTYLVNNQHFETFEVSVIRHFYQNLQRSLSLGNHLSRQMMVVAKDLVQNKGSQYNIKTQELVRSKFNSRMVLTDITSHPYIYLLSSRSYFHLIFIQGQILHRFQNFKNVVMKPYPHLTAAMTLQNFIMLDDYVPIQTIQIYSQFVFGCLNKVKKFINRTLNREPYSQTVQKLHKDIIRQFRPSMQEYFLRICLVLKERAACLKEAVGSIIVNKRRIISTGYNGTPFGTINCYHGGCLVCNNSEKMGTQVLSCRCIHAEYNCILTAGIKQTPGATLYSTKLPCLWCAKLIIQGKIKIVIYLRSKYSSLQYENIELVKKTFIDGEVQLHEMEITGSE